MLLGRKFSSKERDLLFLPVLSDGNAEPTQASHARGRTGHPDLDARPVTRRHRARLSQALAQVMSPEPRPLQVSQVSSPRWQVPVGISQRLRLTVTAHQRLCPLSGCLCGVLCYPGAVRDRWERRQRDCPLPCVGKSPDSGQKARLRPHWYTTQSLLPWQGFGAGGAEEAELAWKARPQAGPPSPGGALAGPLVSGALCVLDLTFQ